MMKRRTFIAGLGSAAGWSVVARAQKQAMPIIGVLQSSSLPDFELAFNRGLNESGFVEGRNVVIEMLSANGQYDQLPSLASELLGHHVSLLVANGAVSAALAAKAATQTTPVLFAIGSDPVKWGLVTSLNRPGGNVTGVTIIDTTLAAKRVELVREALPRATVVGLLLNPNNPNAENQVKELQGLAQQAGWTLQVVNVQEPSALQRAFVDLVNAHANTAMLASDAFLGSWRGQIVELAAQYRLPVIFPFPTPGGLMSYGVDAEEVFRELGIYAAKVLRGERPADLPVVQATKTKLVINLKTAKTLGLTLPLPLLARADEVIE